MLRNTDVATIKWVLLKYLFIGIDMLINTNRLPAMLYTNTKLILYSIKYLSIVIW